MDYLIQKYLKENNLTGINGIDYILQDNGSGCYISKWNLNIAQPSFTNTDYEFSILEQAKLTKIAQLKANRNAALESSHETQAFEIIDDTLGNKVRFEFSTKATGIPLTEPKSILDIALKNINVKYSCEIIENGVRRKGYVLLNKEIAENLEFHLTDRSNTNVKYANDLEAEINACTTIEEVESININFQ